METCPLIWVFCTKDATWRLHIACVCAGVKAKTWRFNASVSPSGADSELGRGGHACSNLCHIKKTRIGLNLSPAGSFVSDTFWDVQMLTTPPAMFAAGTPRRCVTFTKCRKFNGRMRIGSATRALFGSASQLYFLTNWRRNWKVDGKFQMLLKAQRLWLKQNSFCYRWTQNTSTMRSISWTPMMVSVVSRKHVAGFRLIRKRKTKWNSFKFKFRIKHVD